MDKESGREVLGVVPEGATEVSLIEESAWEAVRGLRERGLSRKAIARELALDIKTVRKWLRQRWAAQRRTGRKRGLDGWESFLRGRAPEVGFNAAVLHRELVNQGYAGSYPTVVRYLRPWREEAVSGSAVDGAIRDRPWPAGTGGLGVGMGVVGRASGAGALLGVAAGRSRTGLRAFRGTHGEDSVR